MSWKVDFTRIKKEYAGRIDTLVQKVSFDLFSKVIMRSPVDKGTFRNNWQVGINQKPSGVVTGKDPGAVNQTGAGSSKAKGKAEGITAKAKGGDVVHMVNNLPYAERIEDGYSPQAPGGVVGVSIAEFQSIVEKVGGKLMKA